VEITGRREAMDFYSNDFIARVECQRRLADLHRDKSRPLAPRPDKAREGKSWTSDFVAWIVARARVGDTFMARTPMNP
jgi:hypothetical protein